MVSGQSGDGASNLSMAGSCLLSVSCNVSQALPHKLCNQVRFELLTRWVAGNDLLPIKG